MKKCSVLFILILLVSAGLNAQIRQNGTAWIAVRSATLKSSTWFFASSRGTLALGAQVTVLQVDGNNAEVRSSTNSSLSGWTSVSNLSARQIVSSSSSASASEVALAGKGFNQEVEDSYKRGGQLNYSAVDDTEKITVSQSELLQFVRDGRLNTGE